MTFLFVHPFLDSLGDQRGFASEPWMAVVLSCRSGDNRRSNVRSDEVEKTFGPVDGVSVLGQLVPEADAFLVGSENRSGGPPSKAPMESPLLVDELRGPVEAELAVDEAGEVGM
ncbi:hypothetical protein [Streptomyces sp. NPDC051636]|uniref:hypothetical protein n=1 Tax=Streptomyces sp. NPDC051636 TaxID=3365663 RepID=UPI0037B84AF7